MATTSSRSRPTRSATALACVVAALGALFLCTPACRADALEQVTAPVEEAVGAVGQTVPSTPDTETAVTAPIEEVVESVAPPAPLVVTAPVHQPGTSPPSVKVSAAGGDHPVRAAVETVVHAANEAVASAAAPARSVPTVTAPSPVVAPEGSEVSAPDTSAAAADANSAPASTDQPPPSPSRRTTFVPAPTTTGATGAPQPRWVAYVWPAVALLGPRLADIAARWGQATTRLAAGASTSAGSSAAAQGIAGVHASGGSNASPESSSLPPIPSAATHQFYSVSTPALVYLGLLALAVIAVALALRREIVLGRRR